ICGSDSAEKLAFAEKVLGKEIPVSDVFQEGEGLDVIAITRGKGWQGVVKRYGVSLNIRKASKSRRHGGSIGGERQAKIMYTIPRSGQMGFQRRTDRNKRVIKISDDIKGFVPSSGFHNYGVLKTTCIAIHGSVPGPVKRLIILRKSLYPKTVKKPELKAVLK
ncbi:MAG: 50S ribosomal protein L3, partial [Candidatus Micrarchaeota archaeon]